MDDLVTWELEGLAIVAAPEKLKDALPGPALRFMRTLFLNVWRKKPFDVRFLDPLSKVSEEDVLDHGLIGIAFRHNGESKAHSR